MRESSAAFLSFTNHKTKPAFLASILLTVFFTLFCFSSLPVFANTLADIQGHWAEADIQKAVESGYVKGYPDSTFRPDNEVTRAEFLTMLNAAFSVPVNDTGTSFQDIYNTDWFAVDVSSAVNAGYVKGYPDNTFRPNQFITREESANLIANLAKMTDSLQTYFKDSTQIAQWSQQSVNILVTNGIMSGYPDGYFYPQKNLTRAEAVVIINRAITVMNGTPYRVSLNVNGTVVNVRSGPATTYDIIGQVKQGDILTALDHSSSDWYKINFNGFVGWVIGQYVDVISDTNRGSDTSRDTPPDAGGSTDTTGGTAPSGDTGISKLVVIDPGHGGSDPGASGINGAKEKDVNLAIALKATEYLKNAGFKVIMTRTDDRYVSLEDRSKIANDAHADIFVSIHSNAYNHTLSGTETLVEPVSSNPVYQNQDDSKRLAHLVQDELVQALGLVDRGVNEQGLYVCRETNAPAILVETAFIDNSQEEALLVNPDFQQKAAEAIGRGVVSYFK